MLPMKRKAGPVAGALILSALINGVVPVQNPGTKKRQGFRASTAIHYGSDSISLKESKYQLKNPGLMSYHLGYNNFQFIYSNLFFGRNPLLDKKARVEYLQPNRVYTLEYSQNSNVLQGSAAKKARFRGLAFTLTQGADKNFSLPFALSQVSDQQKSGGSFMVRSSNHVGKISVEEGFETRPVLSMQNETLDGEVSFAHFSLQPGFGYIFATGRFRATYHMFFGPALQLNKFENVNSASKQADFGYQGSSRASFGLMFDNVFIWYKTSGPRAFKGV